MWWWSRMLPLLKSRKELYLAHGNCFTDDEEDIAAWKSPWQLLSVSLPSQSKIIPSIPKCNSLWSIPNRPNSDLSPTTTTICAFLGGPIALDPSDGTVHKTLQNLETLTLKH